MELRSPITVSNNIDQIGEEWFTTGELTAVGERMHYILGLRNRLRYVNEKKFLSEKFNSKEIDVISTNVERTIASLSSHLQGLYPQSEKLGRILTNSQFKTSDPPVDVNYSRIIQEKTELDNCALPNYMTLIQFTTKSLEEGVNDVESLLKIFSNLNYPGTKSLENEFNEKYKNYIDELKGNNKAKNYTFLECNLICDAFIANLADGKNMNNL